MGCTPMIRQIGLGGPEVDEMIDRMKAGDMAEEPEGGEEDRNK